MFSHSGLSSKCIKSCEVKTHSFLPFLALLGIAVKFLLEDLKPTNCLYYRNLGQLYSLEALVEQAVACMIQNFEEVSQNEDFCHLEISELESLVSSNDIKVMVILHYMYRL